MAGVQVYLQALANGNTTVNLWGISRAEIIRRCGAWKVTHLSATPTFYRLLLPLEEPLSAVRSISIGGEPAGRGLIEQLQLTFPRAKVRNIYASTEAGALFFAAGEEFEVPNELTQSVRCDAGRLWIHRRLLGDGDFATEWHDTGDLVEITMTVPLRFRIVGRVQGWINVGGEKVNPSEVEEVLVTHSAISLARVHGRRNLVTGNILVADVVVHGNAPSLESLYAFLEQRLPPHKRPRVIKFVNTLELTRSGKVPHRE